MNILVFDRFDSWHVNDLRRASGSEHQVTTASYADLSVRIVDENESQFSVADNPVEQFDVIFTRAMPASSLEQIVFRMDWLEQVQKQLGIVIINPAKTIEASVDKYLSFEKLRSTGVQVPMTSVCQNSQDAMRFFSQHNNDVVLKPIFGSRGRGIERVRDEQAAIELFSQIQSEDRVIYLQEYIEHGDWDLRLLVVGEAVHGMRRQRPNHWITNASLGAECSSHEVTDDERQIALTAARSQGAYLAGVDLLYDSANQPIVVEVNANPSWRRISETLSQDIAREIISGIEPSC